MKAALPSRTRQSSAARLLPPALAASALLAAAAAWSSEALAGLPLPGWALLAVPAGGLLFLAAGCLKYDWLVLITFCLVGFVRFEPAPFDLLVLVAAAVGLATGQLRLPAVKHGLLVPAGLWAFALANLLSMFGAPASAESWRFLGITLYMLALLLFARMYSDRPGGMRVILCGCAASAAINAVLVLLSFLGVSVPASVVGWSVRGVGFFKDPNVFGAFAAGSALWVADRAVQPPHRLLRTLLLAGLALLLGVTTCLSLSRAVWINLVVGGAVYLFFLARRSPRLGLALFGLFLASGLAAAALFDAFQMSGFVREHMRIQSYDYLRFDIQAAGLAAGITHPFGVGPAMWPNTHSLYVKTFAEQGLPGLAALMLILAAPLVPLLRRTGERPLPAQAATAQIVLAIAAGQLVNSLVIDSIHWRHLWLLLGIAWALQAAYRERKGGAP